MALPELYRYGREGTWYGMKWFVLYMLDGIYQVRALFDILYNILIRLCQSAIIYFLINYTYSSTPTSRPDGYDQYQYEFTTVIDCF